MSSINTETETVIKKVLPYLRRRGYEIEKDLDFETAVKTTDRYTKGYVDILVTLGKNSPSFLIEAKRMGKNLTNKDRDQAINYARSEDIKVPFVVVTNGKDIQCYNTKNKERIVWDGKRSDKIPNKSQLPKVMRTLKTKPDETRISISEDESLPFRPGLPLRQLNALFAKGHNTIRKIEKDEEFAFADFSKLLFLKLLEEKSDIEDGFELPYSYRFYELAETSGNKADQVKSAILDMISKIINETPYGEVLEDPIHLGNPRTFLSLVRDLASVSFCDCSIDSKGAAFEYYVRATLKGKKLGQYFTPRELVQVMTLLVGENKIINSVITGNRIKVLDPACGTGGFLVFLMQDTLQKLDVKLKNREITRGNYDECIRRVKEEVFFGSDANKGVAASAKMNMIIAGDGHTHIQHEDSLARSAKNWNANNADCDLIMTNPPFGTAEGESLAKHDKTQYSINSTKGQYLFLQKMIDCTVPGGEICTVIDEGVLNTSTGRNLREYILQKCKIKAIVSLPLETFKPNKINVKASLIYMEKRKHADLDLEDNYKITFCKINSLGYTGAGDKIRGFNTQKFHNEIQTRVLDTSLLGKRSGYYWEACDVFSSEVAADAEHRLDFKYWDLDVCTELQELKNSGCPCISEINTINTVRGKSPNTDSYVDEEDGYAIVIKAGSNISKFGELVVNEESDWIEKSVYDEFVDKAEKCGQNLNIVKKNDVLLASTGDGTLGKCCVYDRNTPAIADGHVTIIRVDEKRIDPYYLVDYLRQGFGAKQITRLYSGSTGLIELTPDMVEKIYVDLRGDSFTIELQKAKSKELRKREKQYLKKIMAAEKLLKEAQEAF